MFYYLLDEIRERVSQSEVLAQLAEEASELAHAALKLRRAYDGRNPTPVSIREAYDCLLEEFADIKACADVLGFDRYSERRKIEDIEGDKLTRWATRLMESEKQTDDTPWKEDKT